MCTTWVVRESLLAHMVCASVLPVVVVIFVAVVMAMAMFCLLEPCPAPPWMAQHPESPLHYLLQTVFCLPHGGMMMALGCAQGAK